MGSHASQLNQKERWQVISYIKSMSGGVVIPDALKTVEMEKVTDIIGTGSTVELLPETLAGH